MQHNLMRFCDLHTHSLRSDGTLDPLSLLKLAEDENLKYLALTDHNRLISSAEFSEFCRAAVNLTLIPGAEFSAIYKPDDWDEDRGGIEIHIVVLGYTPGKCPFLQAIADQNNADRKDYVEQILCRLRNCGFKDIGSYEDLRRSFPDTGHIGRMTIAKHMVNNGYVRTVDEAFYLYLGTHGERRAYVKSRIKYASFEDVIRAAVKDKAVPVLAHLFYYSDLTEVQQESLVKRFREAVGLDAPAGLEVFYGLYCKNPDMISTLQFLSQKYNLIPSCGSDFHGQDEDDALGRFPVSVCEKLLVELRNYYDVGK